MLEACSSVSYLILPKKLNKSLNLDLASIKLMKIELKADRNNAKEFLSGPLTEQLQVIDKTALITDSLMMGKMVDQLLVDRL